MSASPAARPVTFPKNPTIMPCARKTQTIWPGVAPSAFITPISRVFCTVTVMSVLMMPKAATITMKSSRKNMVFRSRRMASKICLFRSIQVRTWSGKGMNFSSSSLSAPA